MPSWTECSKSVSAKLRTRKPHTIKKEPSPESEDELLVADKTKGAFLKALYALTCITLHRASFRKVRRHSGLIYCQ